jgi:anti-anti-sigma factor
MPADLAVRLESTADGHATLFVTGEVDRTTSSHLRHRIREAARDHRHLAVDLDGVEYLDSSAIAVLFDAIRTGEAVMVATSRCAVRRALEVTGLPLQDA